ncbi:hypothetical protein AGLY_013026 [Aphis glycines]|uniref:Uncharacterized protein n=1 Tax=Aphis glycines TaxID=307491 RepID=A0A6G0T9P4_APHGL|nr:hypothetical protein AGLY_013026 [Aphis glycines]
MTEKKNYNQVMTPSPIPFYTILRVTRHRHLEGGMLGHFPPLTFQKNILNEAMMCFFCCIPTGYSIIFRNSASISNFGGGFQWKSEYPWCIIEFLKKSRKTKKKNDGKTRIFTQTSFRPNRLFHMVVTQKLITLNFQNILTFIKPLKFSIFMRIFFEVSIKFFCSSQNTWKFNTKFL